MLCFTAISRGAYVEPSLATSYFDLSKTSLTPQEKELVATYLASLARSLDASQPSQSLTCSRALGIALRLDPTNRSAIIANAQLKQDVKPKPEPGYNAQEASQYVLNLTQRLQKENTKDSSLLASYLLVLTESMDPANEDLLFAAETASKQYPPDWSFASSPQGSVAASSSPASPAGKPSSAVAKSQSKINGLVVLSSDGKEFGGQKMEIIATCTNAGTAATTVSTATAVAEDMKISLDEALRATLQKKPESGTGNKITISFDDKYSKKAGGSAGTAFALAIYSLLDGYTIDPFFAVTGDITVDGKTRQIGGIPYKLRGAYLDKCRIVGIPRSNEKDVGDLLLTQGAETITNLQVFSLDTLDDALALARTDRADSLRQAIEKFAVLQLKLTDKTNPLSLRSPEAQQTLAEILKLAPNHLSADYLLRLSQGRAPQKLGIDSSIEETFNAADPLLAIFNKPENSKNSRPTDQYYYKYHFSAEDYRFTRDHLKQLEKIIAPEVENFYYSVVSMTESIENMDGEQGFVPGYWGMNIYSQTLTTDAGKRSSLEALDGQIRQMLEQLRKMDRDQSVLEKRLH